MTIVGTRPEIIRLSRVIAVLEKYFQHVLVHTGQNYDYELNQIFFSDLGLKRPDFFLDSVGRNAAETIGNIISRTDSVLEKVNPDAFLVLGDTNSCLAAYAAKRRKIPIFHMEAGNRCFDQRVPEEINRRIVDHISDINMPYSSISREYLLREGLAPDRVIKTGSPMHEVLHHYQDQIDASNVVERMNLKPREYFVVSSHREENVDNERTLQGLAEILDGLATEQKARVIVSTHPRTRKRFEEANLRFDRNVELLKPLGFFDYVKLQKHARLVLSDSGTISEESSILNFPALNLREAHERPEAMEEASVMMVGMNYQLVKEAMPILDRQGQCDTRVLCAVADYSCPNVSEKVARIILSYKGYVDRTVWRKV